jgi:hypothetical protein
MYGGKIVFAQLIDQLSVHTFRRCVQRYRGHYKVQSFSCLDQYLCMAFAQLTYRESLRDIEACLRAQNSKHYDMGACLPSWTAAISTTRSPFQPASVRPTA